MNASLNHLTALYPAFSRYYLLDLDSVPRSAEDEHITLSELACPVMDFSASVVKNGNVKDWFSPDNLNVFVAAIFNWAQMTITDVSLFYLPMLFYC